MYRLLFAALLLFVARADATYESVVAADTPCHWWKMQEASLSTIGDTQGASCSNHDMTWTGSPSVHQTPTGVLNAFSVALNGTSQYGISHNETGCGYRPSTTGGAATLHMSWEYWARVHGSATGSAGLASGLPFSSYEPSFEGWYGYFNADNGDNIATWAVRASTSVNFRVVISTSTANGTVDIWHYIAATWDGTSTPTLKLYLDGVNEATATSGSGSCCGCGEYIDFGTRNTQAELFNGSLQYVAMYGGPGSSTGSSSAGTLTPTQVLAHYNAGISVPHGAFPWIVRKPELPQFRNPDYFARMVRGGYHTGLFDSRLVVPQWLTVGYVPFDVVPMGIEN